MINLQLGNTTAFVFNFQYYQRGIILIPYNTFPRQEASQCTKQFLFVWGTFIRAHCVCDNYTLINQNTNEVLLVCEQPPTLVGRGRYALSECTQEHKSETTNETPASENYLEGGPAVEADQGGLPSIKNYQPDTGFLRLQLVQSSYLERCKQADVCIPLLQPQDDNWPQPETGYFLALITDKDYGLRFRTDGKSPAGEQCVAIRETRPSNSVWNSDRNLLCTRYKTSNSHTLLRSGTKIMKICQMISTRITLTPALITP